MLKSCKCALSIPIAFIFNWSLRSSQFPSLWKHSYVIPSFKVGPKDSVINYRPISKLSSLPKLFEKLLETTISCSFKNVLSVNQHGFRSDLSTETNLLCFYSDILKSIEAGLQVDVLYTDIQKAFDSVNHELLIHKLKLIGISGNLIDWFHSYLLNRSQQVMVNGHLSSPICVTSGVPQGEHLSPWLFLIFLVDINRCFKFCKYKPFAHDLKLYYTISHIEDSILLQDDLNRLSKWCTKNGLNLNVNKCSKVSFNRNKLKTASKYFIDNNTFTLL